MKSYHEFLKDSIAKSGLSLSEISKQLIDMGFLTKDAYLSRLQNGKIAPARDDLNSALAYILNIDEDQLILAAQLEKAPAKFAKLFTEAVELNSVLDYVLTGLLIKLNTENMLSEKIVSSLIGDSYSFHDASLLIKQLNEQMSLIEKWNMYYSLTNDFQVHQKSSSNINQGSVVCQTASKKAVSEAIEPVISYFRKIYSNYYTDSEDLIKKEVVELDTEHNNFYKLDEMFFIQAYDDGMNLDGINEGDKVLVAMQKNFTGKDIILLAIDDQAAIMRRIQVEGDSFIIRSSNPLYPVSIYPKERISILGKVVSVYKNINFD